MRDKKSIIALLKYIIKGNQLVYLEYPITGECRYKAPNGILFFERLFASHVDKLLIFKSILDEYKSELSNISFKQQNPLDPFWENPTLSPLDGASLYSIVRKFSPSKVIEIGSGNSTKFMHLAIKANEVSQISTDLISIDPNPRSFVDSICNQIIRTSLENTDLSIFSNLKKGDFVFFDGSHRGFQNNDVSIFFLEILPSLEKGILIGIHDIWLPYDYPIEWTQRFYNEQLVLGAYLIGKQDNLNIINANMYASQNPKASLEYQQFLDQLNISKQSRDGGLFVFTT